MKHITRTIAALLFVAAFTLTNESGSPGWLNLICFISFALVARYADRKGYLNESNNA